jgi:mannose-1-phosphate guanylyltransferase
MNTSGNTWAIVLAAGDGRRLHSLTMTESGIAIPKQFCSLRGGHSLLRAALQRAEAVASQDSICVVVARQHKHWWSADLADEPRSNIIVQPNNRGTAIGILLPLLHIMAREPDARIVLLPSDHHVRDEHVLATALQRSVRELDARRDRVLLLGMPPEEADPDLGYIVPGSVDGPEVWTVARFVEKPNAPLARVLIDAGALWNAFIVAAQAQALLEVFVQRIPQIVAEMRSVIDQHQRTGDAPEAAIDLYRDLPEIEFSRQILQKSESTLRVVRVDNCGWSDLGTPKRVAETLRRLPTLHEVGDDGLRHRSGFLNLATQHARRLTTRVPH